MTAMLPGVAIAWLGLAIVLEVLGTMLLKLSDGMRRRLHAAGGILLVAGAFAALAQAIRGMDLSVAYALWGGAGLVLTAIIGMAIFRQRILPIGWLGIALVVAGAAALKLM